ncbi:hypothetical protein JCM3770_000572 [Rhodotorula araucariae]
MAAPAAAQTTLSTRIQHLWNSPAGPLLPLVSAPLVGVGILTPLPLDLESRAKVRHFPHRSLLDSQSTQLTLLSLCRPVSPIARTVFFWAPMFKWGLVAAGLKDLSRPAEVISVPQNLALTATGLIWVRYSFVITPVNYSLAAVNLFVAGTGITSLYRAYDWQRKSPAEQAAVRLEYETAAAKEAAKEAAKDAVTKIAA